MQAKKLIDAQKNYTRLALFASGWYLNAALMDYVATFIFACSKSNPDLNAINAAKNAFELIYEAYLDNLEQFDNVHNSCHSAIPFDDFMKIAAVKIKKRDYFSDKPWIPGLFKVKL